MDDALATFRLTEDLRHCARAPMRTQEIES
jgi:hypothetical protein